ncbi:MAG: outer membrane beta-barrel protein [Bacteroidetes bacterium]|uniref:Outer membrane beta-barrel protein n=1 Tax=Candidatus Gallipaludibacter merdavium TaxID=2840839 RepID=A0A9D9N3R3_9BACT|nr:outer membrane beta-barrel protein [Candidatus Gallipaludibacter merdavium]
MNKYIKVVTTLVFAAFCAFPIDAEDVKKTTFRIEAGYIQPYQFGEGYRTTYFHGGKIGATVDFDIKYGMSIQTGLYYLMAYGTNSQSYPHLSEYVDYSTTMYQLDIPVRFSYTIKIWKDLSLFAFAGPTFNIGLAMPEKADAHLSAITEEMTGIQSGTTNLYCKKVLPFNFMLGAGGGIQWKNYRLQSGYDFGMHNIYRNTYGYIMKQWNWFASFSYAF